MLDNHLKGEGPNLIYCYSLDISQTHVLLTVWLCFLYNKVDKQDVIKTGCYFHIYD